MLQEIFKNIIEIHNMDNDDSVIEFEIKKCLPSDAVNKQELIKLIQPVKYTISKGDKIYFLQGCDVPRFKLSTLKDDIGFTISKTVDNANVVVYSEKFVDKMFKSDYVSNYVTKYEITKYVRDKFKNNESESVQKFLSVLHDENTMDIVRFWNWSKFREVKPNAYHNSQRVWEADIEDLKTIDTIKANKIIVHQDDLLSRINIVNMTEDMFLEACKMFRSEDHNNHVLAMELMANCDYDKSALYLLELFRLFSRDKIYNRREKSHVNFKSLCNYFGVRPGDYYDLDDIINILTAKRVLTPDKLDTLIKLAKEDFAETVDNNSKYFKVLDIVPNNNLLNNIANIERIMEGHNIDDKDFYYSDDRNINKKDDDIDNDDDF